MTLKLTQVSKRFIAADQKEPTQALINIDLCIQDGSFVCLVGPSGCGKSTLLRLLAGLSSPSSGSLTDNGQPIVNPSPKRGMVFQKPTLFPWLSVEKNLSFGPRMLKKTADLEKRVDSMLELSGLGEFRDRFPHQLSGGMQQRLSLIRALINDPEVLLLDEPLGALDAFTRMSMQDEILSLWNVNRSTMVMVTHDIDEAIYMATKVVVMAARPGRILEELPIELTYPRDRTSEQFFSYRSHILKKLHLASNHSIEAK